MLLVFGLFLSSVQAQVGQQTLLTELPVSSYALMEAESGQFLLAENVDQHLPPASLTKLMTAYLTFKALDEGKLNMQTLVPVSQLAYEQPGSRMFIEVNRQIPVEDLIQGVIVQSGNDASVALAEYIGGSVDGFVLMMNNAAQSLSMSNTHYMNPTGLPDPNHYTTARDIAILSRQIIREFPEYYHFYSQQSFTHNKITQKNRNLLLYRNANVDGLKTGHTQEAGYCLASSEKRGDLRLIVVVLGGKVEEDRYSASQALLNYGFAQFAEVTALTSDKILMHAIVYKGENNEVAVRAAQDVNIIIPVADKQKVTASLDLQRVIAPVKTGDKIGVIAVKVGGKVYATIDAVAAEDVAEAGFFKRQWHGAKLLFAD
ncbi:MAG: serine-type D-Ala-D-Ala carboxypeptidase [Cardiobacteriales bacterium]|nr:MAG: serine-type D-Ala-D-Ala carboxypeptidase [Cardiobacteriales bacterium]